MITVVIPYYQRTAGVLSRALKSIARQTFQDAPIEVIVIDDESPVPAESEVPSLGNHSYQLKILRRANGGPAAARNTGLDHVSPESRYIAFLDSDDEWAPEHLHNAWSALESGYDFYFANHYQLGQTIGAFERAGRIEPKSHPQISNIDKLHAYQGNMTDQILTGNVIGTSTVVFRRAIAPQLRFREEYRNAGEDYIFWLEFVRLTTHICFSESSEATYGKGVNVYSGVVWGTEEHMSRIRNELRFKLFVRQTYSLSRSVLQHVESSIVNLRCEYCLDLLHVLKVTHRLPWNEIKQISTIAPTTLLMIPNALISIIRRRNYLTTPPPPRNVNHD